MILFSPWQWIFIVLALIGLYFLAFRRIYLARIREKAILVKTIWIVVILALPIVGSALVLVFPFGKQLKD